ncbi:xylulokinase [Candidatus Bipolaricaulota bacterium]|nr:xylulokinase [Candidatus Bipolaricaulota bacterium]
MNKYLLAYDLGTTGSKASLFDAQGQLLANSYDEYETDYSEGNRAEQNPEDWWQAVCDSTKRLLAETGVNPKEIAGISFSGHMMACLPVDRQGSPLRNCIIWSDNRSVDQAQRLVDQVGAEEGYRITGHQLLPCYSAAKIMWVRDNEPDIFEKTYKFLHVKDYIATRLTGAFATDYSDACGMNLFDMEKHAWSEKLIGASGIPVEKLPEVHASSDVIGEVTSQAATETGLCSGIPVVIGGGDGPCAGVGSGVIAEGLAYNYFGSAAWIGIASRKPVYDPQMRTFNFIHLDENLYMPVGASNNGGYSYQCFRNAVWESEMKAAENLSVDIFDLMEARARKVPAGANKLLYLPFIRGERCPYTNPNARGAFIGLTPNHSKADMTRAVLEGVVFNQRIILDALEQQGAAVKEMWVIGGGAKSTLWRQIMADIYRKPIIQPRLLQEANSLGAAIAAGVGVGIFESFEASKGMVEMVARQETNASLEGVYERMYRVFKEAYEQLVPVFESLAQLP